jgi:hypothetical protein
MEELGRIGDFIDIAQTREEPIREFSALVVRHAGECCTGGPLDMAGESLWSFRLLELLELRRVTLGPGQVALHTLRTKCLVESVR